MKIEAMLQGTSRKCARLVLVGCLSAIVSGCAVSHPGNYRLGSLGSDMPAFPKDVKIGVARLQDKRPQVALSNDPSKAFVGVNMHKFGVTYKGRKFMPVGELFQDVLVTELEHVGVRAVKLETEAATTAGLQTAGRAAGVDFALGGEAVAFEMGVVPGFWTVTGVESVTLSITLVKPDGRALFEGRSFSSNNSQNEGGAVLWTTLIDKMLNIALKNTLKELVRETALATSRQIAESDLSVTKRVTPEGTKISAKIAVPLAPSGDSKVDALAATLKQLNELKAAGVLTEQEYEAKRKALVEKF